MQEIEKLDPAEVCTLPADGLGERLAWIRGEIMTLAVSNERSVDGIAWELRDAPGLAAKLDELVEKERECCSGIVFAHQPSAVAGQRRLTVQGIDPGAAIFQTLDVVARAPTGGTPAPSLTASLAKSAGWGTAFALFVCCVLPIGAAAALGAAAAAPLASLDRPWVIGLVAVLSGGAAFAWQRRNRPVGEDSTAAATGCGPDC